MNIKNKIKAFGLASLLGLSPLSSEAQENPQNNTKTPTQETLYSYIPTSVEQYHETCQKGLQALSNSNVPEELKNLYLDFVTFYEENKEKDINLNDSMVRKSFLAFKKISKYETLNDFGAITPSMIREEDKKGRYNEFSKLQGADAKSFYQTTSKQDPKFIAFCNLLYSEAGRFNILSKEDSPLAEQIANRLLSEKLTAYNIAPTDTTFSYSDNFTSVVWTYDVDNEFNNWQQHVNIDTKTLNGDDGSYCPLSVVKAHELGHIMQTLPGTKKDLFEETLLAELAPTIELIVMQDVIYKEINQIPLKKEVSYKTSEESHLPNIGKIANTFRSIKEKYNLRSYEDVLLTKEASIAINKFTQNINIKEIMENIKKDKELNDFIKHTIEDSALKTNRTSIHQETNTSHKKTFNLHSVPNKER